MTDETTRRIPRGALALNAGMVLVPVALGTLFGAAMKTVNPDGVDVSAELAYLRPILIVAFALVGLALLAAFATNLVLTLRKHPGAGSLWLIFAVQIAALVLLLIGQGWERAVTGS